jgi:uncharacterized membrane protein
MRPLHILALGLSALAPLLTFGAIVSPGLVSPNVYACAFYLAMVTYLAVSSCQSALRPLAIAAVVGAMTWLAFYAISQEMFPVIEFLIRYVSVGQQYLLVIATAWILAILCAIATQASMYFLSNRKAHLASV